MEEAVKKWNLAHRDGSLGELWSGTFCRSVQSAELQYLRNHTVTKCCPDYDAPHSKVAERELS